MTFQGKNWQVGMFLIFMVSVRQLPAQSPKTDYPRMAPVEQYLMDRTAEIALARSAAPEAISREATILVLGRHGYDTAVQGTNGFVCMVERGWIGALDWPEFWNPKTRGADCLNPPAARSMLPLAEIRTEMVLAGHSKSEILDRIKIVLHTKEVPPLEPGSMSYMMAKGSYLTDEGDHNGPHLMFYLTEVAPVVWGAGVTGSPVGSGPYWFFAEKTSQELDGLPPLRIFTVSLGKWSDGTEASAHEH